MSKVNVDTPWRRMATAIYKAPTDGRTYGTFELDAKKVLELIERKKEQGIRITVTQVVVATIARAIMTEMPETNAYVKRGKVIARDSMDVFISVNLPGKKEMGGFVLRNADKKTIDEIAAEVEARVEKTRARQEEGATKNKNLLAQLPWPFRRWVFVLIRWFVVTMGFSIKSMNLDASSFGSVMISNIGTHGLQFGFAALFPASNLPLVILMGMIEDKPVVREGEIVIRPILPLAGVLDHRIFDGAQSGIVAMAMKKIFDNPEILDTK